MDDRAYNKLSDGKLIGVFNRTVRENSKLRSLSSQTGNVQKTSFPFGLPYK